MLASLHARTPAVFPVAQYHHTLTCTELQSSETEAYVNHLPRVKAN